MIPMTMGVGKNAMLIAELAQSDPFLQDPPQEAYEEWSEDEVRLYFTTDGDVAAVERLRAEHAAAVAPRPPGEPHAPAEETSSTATINGEPGQWSIRDLKRFLEARGVAVTGLAEKGDLVQVVRDILSGELELGEPEAGDRSAEGGGGGAGSGGGGVKAYAEQHPRDREYFNGGGKGFLTDTEQVSETFSKLGGQKDVQRSKMQMAALTAPERDADDQVVEKAEGSHVEHTMQVGAVAMHYVTWGKPTDRPVLLLHGINQTAFSWEELALALAEAGYYAVGLELRGHGDTDWAPDPKDYSCHTVAADVRRFLKQLALPRRPACVAYQMGAAAAQEIADEFAALVIAEYTPDMAPDKFTYFYWQAMRYPSLEDAVAHMWTFSRGRRTVENIRRRLRHSMRRFEDGSWGYKMDPDFYFSYSEREKWAELERVECPALVVRGEASHLWSARCVGKVVAALRRGASVQIPEAGHWVAGDNKPAFRAAVLSFFDDALPKGAALRPMDDVDSD